MAGSGQRRSRRPAGGVARGVACSRGGRAGRRGARRADSPGLAAASGAHGRRSASGRCRMLPGSPALHGSCSARPAPARPGPGRTPAMLSRGSPASQPRGVRGESGACTGEAAVRSRSSGGRLHSEPPPAPATHPPPAQPAQGARESGDHRGKGATRAARMDGGTWRLGWRCLLLLALLGSTRSEGMQSCGEVRKLFQWRLGGAVKGLPDAPRAGRSRWLAGQCAGGPRPGTSGLATALFLASRGGPW